MQPRDWVLFVWLIETGSCYVSQAGLCICCVAYGAPELTILLPPFLPKSWDYRRAPHLT